MKRRLLSMLCALALCLSLLPAAALADGLEPGTPTLLDGEDETGYATPSTDDGWSLLTSSTWYTDQKKTYEQPFYSDLPIHVEAGGSLTAPSITVEGRVEVTGSARLNCSGELRAEELHVSVGATVGTLSCLTVFVSDSASLAVTSRWNCSGTVEVDGALYLPAETVPNWNNFSGNGTVYIGETAYTTAGVSQGTAMLMLFPGTSASGEGYTWDGETCTLTLDGFTRTYGENADGSIGIMAEGEDVTLELKGENVMTGLSGNAMGIYCEGGSLTLKGAGSLDCGEAMAALVIYDGSLALAEGYSLNEEAEIYNISDGESSAGHVIRAGTAESNPIPATSFSLVQAAPLTTLSVGDTMVVKNGYVQTTQGAGWSYDPETNTLTLNGLDVHYQGTSGNTLAGIFFQDLEGDAPGAVIVLEGQNSITSTSALFGIVSYLPSLMIKGTGSLEINAGNDAIRSGSGGDQCGLIIQGCTLNVSGSGNVSSGIYASGKLELIDANVTATGPYYGAVGETGITVTGGELSAAATDSTGTGLYSIQAIVLKDAVVKAEATAQGSYCAISAGTGVSMTNADVTLSSQSSNAIYTWGGSVSMQGGSLNASAPSSVVIWSKNNITMEDADVTASSDKDVAVFAKEGQVSASDSLLRLSGPADMDTIRGNGGTTLTGSWVESRGGTVSAKAQISNSAVLQDGTGEVTGSLTLPQDVSIPALGTLTVPQGAELTVPEGMTLTVPEDAALVNKGTIINNGTIDGVITGSGTVEGDGTITGVSEVTITGVTAQDGTYNGQAQTGYTGTPSAQGYTGDFTVTYNTEDGTAPINAGEYTVTIAIPDNEPQYTGSITLDFTVAKAAVTVTAPSLTIQVGEAIPDLSALSCSITGLVGSDAMGNVALAYEGTPDSSQTGSYAIVPSGGTFTTGSADNYNVQYGNGTLTIQEKEPEIYTVTFNANGGSGQMADQSFTFGVPQALAANTFTRSGYTFAGWNTKADGSGTAYGDRDTLTIGAADLTLYAQWTKKSSDSDSDHDNEAETDKNPDGSTTTTVTKPDGSTTETTKWPDGSKEVVETKKDGTVTTTTTDTAGNKTEVVDNTDGSTETTVTNKDGSSSATKVDDTGKVEAEVKLPATVVEDAQEKGEAVVLPMPSVSASSDWDEAPTVTVDLPSGTTAKVEIPVENVTAGTVAVIVKADGTEEVIKTSLTTENGVAVTLSDGDTVKIVDNSKTFEDVPATYWGAEAVDFAVSRELFAGTSATTFAPDTAMTRAMIVTVLARFESVDTTTGDTWYEAGQQWAMQNGISDGSNMEQGLTREQLATMLYRYAQSKGYDTTQGGMAIREYADFEQISDYAVEAMTWAVNTGLISGTSTTTLSPQGLATRAQVATILMRFIEGMA